MKTLLKILAGIAALLVLLSLVGLLLPRQFHVERSLVFKSAPSAVVAPCADLREWRKWGVWYRRDPAMTTSYATPPTGVGSWVEWKSKSQGDGKMIMTKVEPDEVVYRLEFPDMPLPMTGTMHAVPEGSGTRLVWSTDGDLGMNPASRWLGLFLDRMLGPDFEQGLANLREVVDK